MVFTNEALHARQTIIEYAVIRIVPRVDREEFLNVGVVLYCPRLKFLELIYTLDRVRLLAFSPALDVEEIGKHLGGFCGSGAGRGGGRPDRAARYSG